MSDTENGERNGDALPPSPRYAGERGSGEAERRESVNPAPSPQPSLPSTGERKAGGTARFDYAAPPVPAPAVPISPWLALALLAVLLFWASAFAAIRVGLRGYSPQSLALLRFLVASVAMGVFVLFAGPFKRPTWQQLPLLVAAAVTGIPVYHVSLNYAEVTVGAGPAALLINTSPVMAALLAAAALRERLGAAGWAGTLLSFAGAAVIAAGNGIHAIDPRAGFVLVAAAGGAIYTVIQKPLLRTLTPVSFTAWAIWIGTACLLPMVPKLAAEFRAAPMSSTLAAAYMGVFPTALSYAMWAKVISRMNVSRAVSFLYLVPVFAVTIAWIWLGEVPAMVALFGGAMVIGGVVLVNMRPKPVARGFEVQRLSERSEAGLVARARVDG